MRDRNKPEQLAARGNDIDPGLGIKGFRRAARLVHPRKRKGSPVYRCSALSEDEAVAAGASPDTAGKRAAKGAAAGAGAGLLFGLPALAIPGVGPFITAGALASALGTTGGALAAGAIVGGTSGAITGGLSRAGYSREQSEFYGPTVERGGVLVAVETEGVVSPGQAGEVLARHGGSTYGG